MAFLLLSKVNKIKFRINTAMLGEELEAGQVEAVAAWLVLLLAQALVEMIVQIDNQLIIITVNQKY